MHHTTEAICQGDKPYMQQYIYSIPYSNHVHLLLNMIGREENVSCVLMAIYFIYH